MLWLVCLSMNFVLVVPLYESGSFPEDAVALYIMHLDRLFPCNGHLDWCLQLHVFVAALMGFFISYFCIMRFDDVQHVS